jgi:hypothetical protein
VSDPGARAGNSPARVRRGRPRHRCRCPGAGRLSVCGRSRKCRESGSRVRAERNADRPDHPVSLVREILVPELHSFRHAMTQPDAAFVVTHFEVRDVSTNMTTLDAPAITQLIFNLCSTPCKARRFAPPAHARGLRALTVPARRSRLGHYVMAGSVMTLSWTDLDR